MIWKELQYKGRLLRDHCTLLYKIESTDLKRARARTFLVRLLKG
nr:MAG TPA_asm: hypothetical protein [Caudoviricetes sp.]